MPAPHPVEFRQRAVELARTGDKPVAALAKDLGISESCLRNWMAQADADDGRSSSSSDRLTSAEKKELAELRRRNRQLEMENDILKRAAAYFAKENILPK
jgi:transposase